MPSRRTARRNRRTARRNRKTARRFPPYGPRRRKNRRVQRGGVWGQGQLDEFKKLMNNLNEILEESPDHMRDEIKFWWTDELFQRAGQLEWSGFQGQNDEEFIMTLGPDTQQNLELVSALYKLYKFAVDNDDREIETFIEIRDALQEANLYEE